MNQQLAEAVRQLPLNPIIDPVPVGWWPPAIGWWLLLLLIVVIACLSWFIGYRRYLKPALQLRRQRQGLRRELRPLLQMNATGAASSINIILKAHLLKLGHERCKALTGQAWQDYLAAEAGLSPAEAEAIAPLGEASYRPPNVQLSNHGDRAFNAAIMVLTRRLAPQHDDTQAWQATQNG